MTSPDYVRSAYARHQTATRSPRDGEYAAFARVTALLRAANDPDAPFTTLAQAVHQNRQLWTHLAAAVADDDNALPVELRARLFYLAEFTQTHSRAVLSDKAEIAPLIDINTAVMHGLNGRPEAA